VTGGAGLAVGPRAREVAGDGPPVVACDTARIVGEGACEGSVATPSRGTRVGALRVLSKGVVGRLAG
jgi:hypothetical protein